MNRILLLVLIFATQLTAAAEMSCWLTILGAQGPGSTGGFEAKPNVSILVSPDSKMTILGDAFKGKTPAQMAAFVGYVLLSVNLSDDKVVVSIGDLIESPTGIKRKEASVVVASSDHTVSQKFPSRKLDLYCEPIKAKK